MIRRLELAQALVARPELLVLDEPTVGLDPIARDGVWERVHRMRAEHGMTVLLTTHYMDEADALCDTVALLHRGRLAAVGSPARLKAELGGGATLEDVFRHHAGVELGTEANGGGAALRGSPGREKGGLRDVRRSRATARRLG
jgi:ABC-2 type transport system ATP-binding protein